LTSDRIQRFPYIKVFVHPEAGPATRDLCGPDLWKRANDVSWASWPLWIAVAKELGWRKGDWLRLCQRGIEEFEE
jgi:hypothetical protein